jgi:ribosomal-protein-alanine N-acetyltransferase
MRIRLAQPSDLARLMAISTAAGAAHWTPQQWQDIFHSQTPARLAWIAEVALPQAATDQSGKKAETAIGFLVALDGGPEWELENVAVLPAFRRRGAGRALLAVLLRQAAGHAERILLEVRASNLPAIRLYNLSGFQQLAFRRDYYRNPTEDALILVHSL